MNKSLSSLEHQKIEMENTDFIKSVSTSSGLTPLNYLNMSYIYDNVLTKVWTSFNLFYSITKEMIFNKMYNH